MDDEMVGAAARALAVAHDADACFDPLKPDADGYISEDAREEWESGEEDREWFRAGALAVLKAAGVHPGLLRWCRWPGCWAHFNAATDEGLTRGWRRHRSDLECPAHADLGHWPGWRMADGEGPRGIVAECRCGAEHPIPSGRFQAAEDWWDDHARSSITA